MIQFHSPAAGVMAALYAGVVEQADTGDLKSPVGNNVRVRLPSSVPIYIKGRLQMTKEELEKIALKKEIALKNMALAPNRYEKEKYKGEISAYVWILENCAVQ